MKDTPRQHIRAAVFSALGMNHEDIARLCGCTRQNIQKVLAKDEYRKKVVPAIMDAITISGRLLMSSEDIDDYIKGTGNRAIARRVAIERFSPCMLYKSDGLPMTPNEIPEAYLYAIKGISKPTMMTIKDDSEEGTKKYPIYEYDIHEWTKASEELLISLGHDVGKRAAARVRKDFEEKEQEDIIPDISI